MRQAGGEWGGLVLREWQLRGWKPVLICESLRGAEAPALSICTPRGISGLAAPGACGGDGEQRSSSCLASLARRNDKRLKVRELFRFRFEHQVVVEGGFDGGLGAVDCAVVFVGFVIDYVVVARL